MAVRTVGVIPERKDLSVLTKFYGKISKEIKAIVMNLVIEGYTEIRAMRARKLVEGLVHRLNVFVSGWTRTASRDAYRDAVKIGVVRMDILGLKSDPEFDKTIHARTIDIYRDDTFKVFVESNSSIIENVNALFSMARAATEPLEQFQAWDMRDEAAISELMDEMLKEGATRQAAKKAVMSHFLTIMGDGDFININGKNYNLKKYAKMVGRTRLRKLQSEAAKNMAIQYDNDLVEISDHNSEFDDICLEYEGNIYSLSGKTPGYDVLSEYPPFHPNCMHSMFATSPEALEARELFGG